MVGCTHNDGLIGRLHAGCMQADKNDLDDVGQVAALRSLSTFAAVSEEAAAQLRCALISLLGGTQRAHAAHPTSMEPTCAEDPTSDLQKASATLPCHNNGADGPPPHEGDDAVAMKSESPDGEEQTPAELQVEALCAARQLLGSFPGMQNDVLPLIGNLFSRQTGAAQLLTFICLALLLQSLPQASDDQSAGGTKEYYTCPCCATQAVRRGGCSRQPPSALRTCCWRTHSAAARCYISLTTTSPIHVYNRMCAATAQWPPDPSLLGSG